MTELAGDARRASDILSDVSKYLGIDSLVHSTRPPQRFEDHVPDFRTRPFVYDSVSPRGPERMQVWAAMDGDRYVAVWTPNMFMIDEASGLPQIDILGFDPTAASDILEMPTRYSRHSDLGLRICTNFHLYGWWLRSDRMEHEFVGGGDHISLI